MAEERATKRFKGLNQDKLQQKKSSLSKDKSFTSKRESKLTLSKALDDEALRRKRKKFSICKTCET